MPKQLRSDTASIKNDDSRKNTGKKNEVNTIDLVDENNPTLKDLYKIIKDMVQSLNFLSDQYEDAKEKIKILEEENKNLKMDAANLNSRLQYIEADYYFTQQQQLQQHFTIHGVPKQKSADLPDIIINIAKILNVNIDKTSIKSIRTINGKNQLNTTPIIVAEVQNCELKNELCNKYKTNGPLIVTQIIKNNNNPATEHCKVYINDYLCSYYKKLLEETKKLKQDYNVKFVWVKNGNIYARKNENEVSYRIKNYNDLNAYQNIVNK